MTERLARAVASLLLSMAWISCAHAQLYPPPPLPTPPLPYPPVTSVTGPSPAGGTITLSLSSALSSEYCSFTLARFLDSKRATEEFSIPMPIGVAYPHGLIAYKARFCGVRESVKFTVEFPEVLPANAQWWKYGPLPGSFGLNPHWYAIPSTVEGNRITFSITDGGIGDDFLFEDGEIVDPGMLVIPGGPAQDLWWSGPAENGWGMSIIQHRDVLFANVFAYDAQGKATWYVMPSGSWDAAHKVYTGNLYLPKGAPFYAYDASKFDVGAPVGTANLTFADPNGATFAYTINGVSGTKNISRVPFGPEDMPLEKALGDLWWAGVAQNGWGIALLQHDATLFALWFTYDANGKATWFVMPDIQFVFRDTFNGKVYRPEGPAWLGVAYDASRHRTVEVGSFTLRFEGEGATFGYSVDGKSGSIALSRIPF